MMKTPQNWIPLDDDEEELLAQVKPKKTRDILSKTKITRNELDEVFNG